MSVEVNAHELVQYVKLCLRNKLVPNILGSPGIGKSELVAKIAKDYGLELIDLRLSQLDPTDLNI